MGAADLAYAAIVTSTVTTSARLGVETLRFSPGA